MIPPTGGFVKCYRKILKDKKSKMLNIILICLDRAKDSYFRAAMDEYIKRISKYAKFTEKVIKPENLPDNPSKALIDAALSKEADAVLGAIPKNAYKIAMCVEGKLMSSPELASLISKRAVDGFSDIVFIIGSSHGLSDKVKNACDLKLSVSPMTFAHGLFAVMLCEQIYRAFTINAGEKYHK